MKKSELIAYVEKITAETTLKNILSDKDTVSKLGKTQFRTMAELCEKADCFEEIRLMLEYRTAKRNGWEIPIKNGKKCGDVFIEYIEEIKAASGPDEREILRNMELFFGYMYWKATVLIEETKSEKRGQERNFMGRGHR